MKNTQTLAEQISVFAVDLAKLTGSKEGELLSALSSVYVAVAFSLKSENVPAEDMRNAIVTKVTSDADAVMRQWEDINKVADNEEA